MTDKPSRAEDEYFARQEVERRKLTAIQQAKEMENAERERRRELHYMKCPKCGMDLHAVEFRGVTLDRCYNCHGTWLDHGEMEQILRKQEFLDRFMGLFRDQPIEDEIEEHAREQHPDRS